MLYIERYVYGFVSSEVQISTMFLVAGHFISNETKAFHKEASFQLQSTTTLSRAHSSDFTLQESFSISTQSTSISRD